MASYGRTSGRVLELGSFSGGISYELAAQHPNMGFTLVEENREYLAHLNTEIENRKLSGRIEVICTPLDTLPFGDASFDLVILRGAFFFIMNNPRILSEIYRMLTPGGLAFVGGGYGASIPQRVIDSISEESRILNDRLGRRRVTLDELRTILRDNGLEEKTSIIEDGGVWLLMRNAVDLAAVKKSSQLVDALDLQPSDVIGVVGAGGKTSLMFKLARELSVAGKKVITTTTTQILEPSAEESSCVIVEEDEDGLLSCLSEEICKHNQVTAARFRLGDGKLKGLLPKTVDRIASLKLVDYIINEADGAARKPIKAPNATEPIIPSSTTLVIALVGIDALNAHLSQEIAFRPALITSLTGLPEGSIITREVIATLVTSNRGIIQNTPENARIVPFINKTELARDTAEVNNLAGAILARGNPQIKRVVSGSLQARKPEYRIFETD
jgi:probable selenium-dependent hydroxylase accessory protein YqeC